MTAYYARFKTSIPKILLSEVRETITENNGGYYPYGGISNLICSELMKWLAYQRRNRNIAFRASRPKIANNSYRRR